MSFDPNLGQSFNGNQLTTVPPNASKDEQTAVLNEVIGSINALSLNDVVAAGTTTISTDGLSSQVFWTIPHNLGWRPGAHCYITDVTITLADGTTYPHTSIQLPTYLLANNVGVGGDGHPVIDFGIWLDFFVDNTNLYIHMINAASLAKTETISYILTRNPI